MPKILESRTGKLSNSTSYNHLIFLSHVIAIDTDADGFCSTQPMFPVISSTETEKVVVNACALSHGSGSKKRRKLTPKEYRRTLSKWQRDTFSFFLSFFFVFVFIFARLSCFDGSG